MENKISSFIIHRSLNILCYPIILSRDCFTCVIFTYMYMRTVIYNSHAKCTITIYFNTLCAVIANIDNEHFFFPPCPIYPFYLRVKKIINLHIVLE